ncbi:MAG TPA: hypothetical protein VGX92_16720 [Pyrinomonadaceae bacterium]|jgi:hypothetical protein|nr:hypothetical protein [Pyrinomonadaceae bacterium]
MGIQGRGIISCSSVAIIIIALLVASCGNKRGRNIGASPATTVVTVERTLPPLPVRPLSPRLRELRARAMEEAARLRELGWKDEVGMAELSGWEYGTRANEMAQALGGDELRALGRLAAQGGVLPEGTDLVSLGASFLALSASATYSPLDKQVLLVDKANDDGLLTHEFVHALQDQHFDLMKLLGVRPYSFDRTEAAFAVIEGDAMSVQRRAEEGDAYGRRPLDDIGRQEGERFARYRAEAGKLFPPLLVETFIFRYRDGTRFVEAVRRRGGERAVDELFLQRPPASSEQILHPEKYFQAEAPRDISLNEAGFTEHGWRTTSSTPVGEIGVRGMLMAGVSEQEAVRGAAGWGGDRAYLFERGQGTPLFIWKTAWDRAVDAEEFFRAYVALQRLRALAGETSKSGDERRAVWKEAGRTTLAYLSGASVIIVRGSESDVDGALELARGQ